MITTKCRLCGKRVWFWHERTGFEVTPDWVVWVHKDCYDNEDLVKEFWANWFKEVEA